MYGVNKEILVYKTERFEIFASYRIKIENTGRATLIMHEPEGTTFRMPPNALYLRSGRGIAGKFSAVAEVPSMGSILKVRAECLRFTPTIELLGPVATIHPVKTCKCGAHSVKSTKHYDWCDLYVREI